MTDDFEKLDQEMMEQLKKIREKPIPESVRKNFAEEVEQKIIDGQAAAGGGFGWAVVLAPALLVFVGVIVFLKLTAVPEPKPAAVLPATQPIARNVISNPEGVRNPVAEVPTPIKKETPAVAPTPVQPSASEEVEELSIESETELLSEIEVLKELGVWSEEDDQVLDISMEDTLNEMAVFAEDIAAFDAPPVGSVQGA